MKLVTKKHAVEIYSHMLKTLEDLVDEEFIAKYPDAVFCPGVLNDQFLLCKNNSNREQYKFQSHNEEIRLKIYVHTDSMDTIRMEETVGNYESIVVGTYKITNPRLLKLQDNLFDFKKGCRSLKKSSLMNSMSIVGKTFSDEIAVNKGTEKMLRVMLESVKLEFGGLVIFSMSGTASFSLRPNSDYPFWERIYGEPTIEISKDAKVFEVGHEIK